MSSKTIPYLLVLALLLVILLQNRGCIGSKLDPEIKRDTVINYVPVIDTFIVKEPFPVKVKPDTIWRYRPKNKPDTSYQGLLKQYNFLGNKHFEAKYYTKTFPIKNYGNITLEDSVKENSLVFQKLTSNLLIPERTITETKTIQYRKLYLGIEAVGNMNIPINEIFASGIFKTKKDQLYGLGIGYNGELVYKASLHWPIK